MRPTFCERVADRAPIPPPSPPAPSFEYKLGSIPLPPKEGGAGGAHPIAVSIFALCGSDHRPLGACAETDSVNLYA